jgi:hypothetical protein
MRLVVIGVIRDHLEIKQIICEKLLFWHLIFGLTDYSLLIYEDEWDKPPQAAFRSRKERLKREGSGETRGS